MQPARFIESQPQDKPSFETNAFWVQKRQFGSDTAVSLRVRRLRQLVLAFGAIIIMLAGTLIFRSAAEQAQVTPHVAVPSPEDPLGLAAIQPGEAAASVVLRTQVVAAKTGIKKGEQLSGESLTIREEPENALPEGAVLAAELPGLLGRYAVRAIEADAILTEDSLSDDPLPATLPFEIPEGFRAITIRPGVRGAVDGFIKPESLVDVLWFYKEKDEQPKVTRILSAVKILSVDGMTNESTPRDERPASLSVTFLVSKRDSKLLELAQNLGTLSLSLVGKTDKSQEQADDPVTVRDILRRAERRDPAVEIDGMLKTTDPATGRTVRYVLGRKGWANATSKRRLLEEGLEPLENEKSYVERYLEQKRPLTREQ